MNDSAKIMVIGNEPRLSYLLGRFAEQSGLAVRSEPVLPELKIIQTGGISFLIFLALENLKEAQSRLGELSGQEIQIVVCAAVGEEAAARELGADHCLVHPLTYESFCTVLASNFGGNN